MSKIILIAICLLLIATPVMASSYYHNLTIEVSGEYEMSTSFAAPDVAWRIDIAGLGEMRLNSIIAAHSITTDWWDMF